MKKRSLLVSVVAIILAVVMVLSLVLSLIPTPVSAASSKEIKAQINQMKEDRKAIQAEMKAVQDQYEENEDEIQSMVNEKNAIDHEISLLYQEIELINQQLSAYALLIADKQDELDEAQVHWSELNEQNKERIRAMEEEGTVSYWSVLFKANSFSDLLDRLAMVEEIAASDQRRLNSLRAAATEVENARNELETEKSELDAAKAELDEAQVVLDEKRVKSDELLKELLAKADELEGLYEEWEAEESKVLDEIAQKEKEYNEAKAAEWAAHMATATTAPPATTKPSSSGGSSSGGNSGGSSGGSSAPSSSGAWKIPCSYRKLTSAFGYRDQPTAGASTYHQGVDLAGPEGTPIYASRAGTVTTATFGKAAGNYVTINHGDGFSSVYMHMTHDVVSVGQSVSQGQLIGYMGSTGVSTGSHLHFGISYNGKYVNPANYIAFY